jgi:hypothetical protein
MQSLLVADGGSPEVKNGKRKSVGIANRSESSISIAIHIREFIRIARR